MTLMPLEITAYRMIRTPLGLTSLPVELQIQILEYLTEFEDQIRIAGACKLLREILVSKSRVLRRTRYPPTFNRSFFGIQILCHNLFIPVEPTETCGFHCVFENGVAIHYLYRLANCLVDVSCFVDEPIFSPFEGPGRYLTHVHNACINRAYDDDKIEDAIWIRRASDVAALEPTAPPSIRLQLPLESTIREWVDLMFISLQQWGIKENNLEIRFSELFEPNLGKPALGIARRWFLEARVMGGARTTSPAI